MAQEARQDGDGQEAPRYLRSSLERYMAGTGYESTPLRIILVNLLSPTDTLPIRAICALGRKYSRWCTFDGLAQYVRGGCRTDNLRKRETPLAKELLRSFFSRADISIFIAVCTLSRDYIKYTKVYTYSSSLGNIHKTCLSECTTDHKFCRQYDGHEASDDSNGERQASSVLYANITKLAYTFIQTFIITCTHTHV